MSIGIIIGLIIGFIAGFAVAVASIAWALHVHGRSNGTCPMCKAPMGGLE